MVRLVTRAERVAQFILVKGTEGLRFAPARPRVVTHARRHIHNHPHRRQHQLSIGENPSVHLAFKPSLRLQAQASTNTASFGNTSPRPTNSAQAPPITAQSPLPNSAPIKKPPPSATPTTSKQDLANGFGDKPIVLDEGTRQVDWARSFHGLSTEAFSKEAAEILCGPLVTDDIEVKPDGMIYLPEIKYRRILNKAFGPGGWGLAPRSETIVTPKKVTREYALVAHGRLVSVARGEQDYFSPEGIPTATEGCKSNAMMRCCKDLGVASELWDPRFVRGFLKSHAREVFVEHQATKKRSKIWLRKDDSVKYPLKETKFNA